MGIGDSPNTYFMREATAAGSGGYTLIAQCEQVQERMEALFQKIKHLALVSLQVQWPGSDSAELASPLPGDISAGDPAGFAKTATEGELSLLIGLGFWGTAAGSTSRHHWPNS